jgi:hypothetical protein
VFADMRPEEPGAASDEDAFFLHKNHLQEKSNFVNKSGEILLEL